AQVDDARAVVGGPAHRPRGVGGLGPLFVADPQRHDARLPGETGHAGTVVALRADQASNGSAMTDRVVGVGVILDEVVAGNEPALELGVVGIDAAVDHGDDDLGGALSNVPARLGADLPHVPLPLGVIAVVGC